MISRVCINFQPIIIKRIKSKNNKKGEKILALKKEVFTGGNY